MKSLEKLDLIKKVVGYLVEEVRSAEVSGNNRENKNLKETINMDESNLITCVDCQNY